MEKVELKGSRMQALRLAPGETLRVVQRRAFATARLDDESYPNALKPLVDLGHLRWIWGVAGAVKSESRSPNLGLIQTFPPVRRYHFLVFDVAHCESFRLALVVVGLQSDHLEHSFPAFEKPCSLGSFPPTTAQLSHGRPDSGDVAWV